MSRKETCASTMTVTMDLDEEPIPLISSFGASFCFYYAMPCTIDVGVVIINGHHHLRGGRSRALAVYQRAQQ